MHGLKKEREEQHRAATKLQSLKRQRDAKKHVESLKIERANAHNDGDNDGRHQRGGDDHGDLDSYDMEFDDESYKYENEEDDLGSDEVLPGNTASNQEGDFRIDREKDEGEEGETSHKSEVEKQSQLDLRNRALLLDLLGDDDDDDDDEGGGPSRPGSARPATASGESRGRSSGDRPTAHIEGMQGVDRDIFSLTGKTGTDDHKHDRNDSAIPLQLPSVDSDRVDGGGSIYDDDFED